MNSWRQSKVKNTFFLTAKAIYFFFREYQTKKNGTYEGEMDNLLFYYSHLYHLIQKTYQDPSKEFRHKKNYIKRDPEVVSAHESANPDPKQNQ
jgi:hypothetical protein